MQETKYFKTKGKRKLILTNEKISFLHNEILLETIKIDETILPVIFNALHFFFFLLHIY